MQQPCDISGASFTPLVVVELAWNTKEEAIKWLLSRIRDKQQSGGAERSAALLLCPQPRLRLRNPSTCARC